jgi:hypothetical protein
VLGDKNARKNWYEGRRLICKTMLLMRKERIDSFGMDFGSRGVRVTYWRYRYHIELAILELNVLLEDRFQTMKVDRTRRSLQGESAKPCALRARFITEFCCSVVG